jgi:hypothetical protein
VTSWIVAIGSVALPLLVCGGWMVAGVLKKRGLIRLARAEGWDVFRGARLDGSPRTKEVRHTSKSRGRAPAPLRRIGESIDQGIVGSYRGRPFGAYRYQGAGGGFNQDGTRQSGPRRTVIHIEADSALPDCTLSADLHSVRVSNPEIELRPDVESWLVRRVGRYRRFHTTGRTISVELRSPLGRKRLLETLDFLTETAERMPLYQPAAPRG